MKELILKDDDFDILDEFFWKETRFYLLYLLPNNILYKINKDYTSKIVNNVATKNLIENLNKYVNVGKLVDFPYGIISFDNRVIGSVSKFHKDYFPINLNNENVVEILLFQLKMTELIEYLYNNGIAYFDINYENFLTNSSKSKISLIDFEPLNVKCDNLTDNDLSRLLLNLSFHFHSMVRDSFENEGVVFFDSFQSVYNYLNTKLASCHKSFIKL